MPSTVVAPSRVAVVLRAGAPRYMAGRVAVGVATLLAVSIVVFAAVHLVPGGYAEVTLGPLASDQAREALAAQYGLDQPLPIQYLHWLGNVLSGDFGISLGTGAPVSDLLARRAPVTVELALLSLLIAMLIGLPLALYAGMTRSRAGQTASRLTGAVAMSTPDFVIGSLFVYLFSKYTLGLTVGEYVPFTQEPLDNLRAMLLPAVTLSVFGIAVVVRTGRDAVANVMSEAHITASLARGETMRHVVIHHVLRNSAIPILTVLAVYVGYLLGGAVIVENLFSLPGLGQAALQAISGRDYAVVQAVVLVAAACFITVNMLADFAYGVIDPRIRGSR